MIPKIIHQTWKTKDIPEGWKKSKEQWISLHPGWEYMLWTDEDNRNLVIERFPDLLELYDSFPYNIQRCDFVRPLILYTYGGVYCDLDIAPTQNFEPLLDSHIKLLKADGRFTNMLMASCSCNIFWLKVIEAMKNPKIPWYAGTRHFYIQATTGPLLLDRVAKRSGMINNDNLFPQDLVQPCSRCSPKPCKTDYSYVELLEGGSWNSWDSKAIDFVSCNLCVFILVILILIFLIVYYRKSF